MENELRQILEQSKDTLVKKNEAINLELISLTEQIEYLTGYKTKCETQVKENITSIEKLNTLLDEKI